MTKKEPSKKLKTFSEFNYVLGILFLTMGCAMMEKADFGLSMVVAPAYLVHRYLVQFSDFFTFGVTEYLFQALLLVLTVIALRRFRHSYLFSFVTAVIYGYTLNGTMALVAYLPSDLLWLRVFLYICGMIFCSIGVAFMLHTYVAAEVYELIVKEVPARFGWRITRFKTGYDCISCFVAILLSFAIFGFGVFEGVKWGTIVCALLNGRLIGVLDMWMTRHFDERDALPLRRFFQ